MSDIQCVQVQVGENKIIEGYFTVDEGLLTMVYASGKPVALPSGDKVEHHISDGQNAHSIAGVLTRKVRKALLNEQVDGFTDEIRYPSMGIV